ncbi:MAG: hypothetical protein VYA51_12865 [Planctomycetota bacterium]|nr:hypothetical protein [Planctomycetota bacterium]
MILQILRRIYKSPTGRVLAPELGRVLRSVDFTPVIIESPYRAEGAAEYLQECIRDCIQRGETPYASHLMLTGALDDTDEEQRRLGIRLGFAMRPLMARTVVYTDLGYTEGMIEGIKHARGLEHPIEWREIRS